MNRELIEAGVRCILEGLEVDVRDHNFYDTPRRVADVYEELFAPPKSGWPVFDENFTDIVMLKGHSFYTLCPHHLLPVHLLATVAYKPNGKVIGASKLMRMVAEANRAPMTQEALTFKIIESIDTLTEGSSLGAACVLRGKHGCFSMRGVRSHAAEMFTMRYSGVFEEDAELRSRFETLLSL